MADPIDVLLADGVIDEVLGRLKSGKEANISLVRRGEQVIAAKVYKDRATRSFKNNADYKEGRKVRNTRTQRAMESGGQFGRDAAEQAWKSAEADALFKLVGSGVRAPAPVLFYEGVLLMELVRDAEGRPAPRLIDIHLDQDSAIGVYADLVAQMISMLCCDLIHGDLSPYNILAAAEGPTIIDFPQVVSAVHSSRAEFFFLRDFDNVVRFVSGFDPSLAVHAADGRAIWRAYIKGELTPDFVPPPPPPPRPTRGPDRRTRPDERGRSQPRPDQRPPDARRQQRPADSREQQRPPDARAQHSQSAGPSRQQHAGPSQQQHAGPSRQSSEPPGRHRRRRRDGGGGTPFEQRPSDAGQRHGGASQGPRAGGPPPARPAPERPAAPQTRREIALQTPRVVRTAAAPARSWPEARPSSGGPPAKPGGRRRPKRRW